MTADVKDEPASVWLDIPPGFRAVPLDEVQERLDRAAARLAASGSEAERARALVSLAELRRQFALLREANTLYFGRGLHVLEGGRDVVSTLVVGLQVNDRRPGRSAVFADVLRSLATQPGTPERVRLGENEAIVVESTRSVVPAGVAVSAENQTQVYQIDALLPSSLGDRLATIGLSTTDVAAGPEFRPLVEALAASVSFHPPTSDDPFAVLGG